MNINMKKLIDEGKIKEGSHVVNVPITKANGEKYNGRTYMIPLEYLYYNDENGRIIISMYQEKSKEDSEFQVGHNEKYNMIMQDMLSKEKNGKYSQEILKLKKDIEKKGQQEPGYVLMDGRVIDGNRRLTALRLLAQDSKTTGQQYYEAVLLEDLSIEDANDKSNIKTLELKIQHGKMGKVDYNAIDMAIDAYKTIIEDKTLTKLQYAESAEINESNVSNLLIEAELIKKFLQFVNAKETAYSIAQDLELDGPLQEIRSKYKRIKEQENGEEVINALFAKIIQLKVNNEDYKKDFRKIKQGVLGTEKEAQFVEEMEESVDSLLDAFEDKDEIKSIDEINEIVNKNEKAKSALREVEEVTNDYAEQVEHKKIMNEPIKIMSRVLNSVKSIDLDVVKNLSVEDRLVIDEKIVETTKILKTINK